MHLPEFDACSMHSALWASGIGRIKIQCVCIEFALFHLKKKMHIYYPLINEICNFQGHVNYRFSVINNHHYACEYFFHYNHGLNNNNNNNKV